MEIVNKCKSGCVAPSGKEIAMGKSKLEEVIVENEITYRLAENGFGEKLNELSGIWGELYCAKHTRYSLE